MSSQSIYMANTIVQNYMSAACGKDGSYFLITDILSGSSLINDSFVRAYVNKHCNLMSEVFDEILLVE